MADGMELRIAASEARTDTKFAQLRGDFDAKFAQLFGSIETMRAELSGELKAMNARIAGVENDVSGIRFWIIGTGVGVLALAIAVFAFGNDRFGLGLDVSAIADQAAKRAVEQALPRQSLGTIDSEQRAPPASP
jgi:hypothetical protein